MLRAVLGTLAMLLLALHLAGPVAAASPGMALPADVRTSESLSVLADLADQATPDPSERGTCIDHCLLLPQAIAAPGLTSDKSPSSRASARLTPSEIGVTVPPPQSA